MPYRRIDPLNPAGSLGPPRLGQGVRGGIQGISRSLIDPLNPASSMNPARRAPVINPLNPAAGTGNALEQKWNQFSRTPNPQLQGFLAKKRTGAISNFQNVEEAQKFTDKDIADLKRMGIDRDMIPLLQDVVRGKRQFGEGHAPHRSMLTEVSRTLGAIEATGAGFFHGTEDYQKEHHYKGRLLDYITHPARIYKELGAGFSEVPTAVRTGYNYGDLIRDSTDKNSLAHKWAMPIGLGASILFDPTTYLSFGATSASKAAAYRILATADHAAGVKAQKLVAENLGKTIQTHSGPMTANWHNFQEIKNSVKIEHGAPVTLGDALEQLKYQGLQQKDLIRRTKQFVNPETGETLKATTRQRLGASLLPNNVLGGRGMRLGGMEVPGTVRLGAKMSGVARAGVAGKGPLGTVSEAFGEALIPDWAARHVMQDGTRASAAVEINTIKATMQKTQGDIARTIREMQRPIMDAVQDSDAENILHSLAPGVKKPISAAEPQRILVGPEARRGIMDMSDDVLDGAQATLKGNITKAVEDQIEGAVKAGLPRGGVTKLWTDLAAHYDDPLRALAEFTFKSTARSIGKTWAKQILEDPRFALPMKPVLEEQKQAAAKVAAEAGKTPKKGVTVNPYLLDSAPAGYTEFAMGSQRWAVHDSMIDAIRDITNPTRLDGGLRRGFKRMNIVQDWWKLYATSPNPAFHVMNMLGAMWNNALAHVYNPGDYFDSISHLYRARQEEAAQQGAKFGLPKVGGGRIARQVPESTPEGRYSQNLLSEAEARAGLGRSSFLFGDVTRGHFTPSQLAMSDAPLDVDSPMSQDFLEGAMETGKGFAERQLTPLGGFREAPTVTQSQVQQAAIHEQIPAPIELVHPATVPDPTEPLTDVQKQTVDAVITRHFHGLGTSLSPTVENTAYVNQLRSAVSPDVEGSTLEQVIGELQVNKAEGLFEGTKNPENWDAFHDAVIKDLERLTKEQKVQYIKPSFPDAPFRTPGELVEPGKYPPLYRPTAEQIQSGAKHFPVMVDNNDPTKIFVGSFEDTPEDTLGRWGVEHADDPLVQRQYTTAIGSFDENGGITVHGSSDEMSQAAKAKAEEVFARVGDKRVARRAPSIQDLAGDKPYLSYFRVYQDPKNPDHVIAGMPGDDHYEVLEELGLNPAEVKDWHQGTGVFDPDTGKIYNVSIVRTGNDDWENPAIIPEDTNALSERAMAAAREIYGETGAKTVSQVVPEQLVTKGKLRKGAIARTYGVTIPRKIAGTALLATGNPIGFMAFMPELARGGRRLAGTIEDMVRLAPFLKYSENKQIAAVLREYGPINSAMQGIDYKGFSAADKQAMYDIGANISRQFQFDYSNLTNFERYVAKSIFPFWTYYKNNLALQVQQIVKQPRLFGVALKTMNYINENGENYNMGPWQEILPAYFQNLMAFQVPVPNTIRKQLGLPPDMPLFLNPKMPFLSINLIPNLWDILRDPSQTTPQNLREVIAPVAGSWGPFSAFPFGVPGSKILLEAGTGYNLGLDRPIDWRRVESGDTQEAYTQAPSFMKYLPDQLNKYFGMFEDPKTKQLMISQTGKYIVEQMTTPFINNLGSAIPGQGGTEEDVQRQKADLVSWLTGVRLMPADVLRLNRNAAYSLLNGLEAKQDRLKSRGQEMPLDDLELLYLVRADLKGIEPIWDMREQDQQEAKNAP